MVRVEVAGGGAVIAFPEKLPLRGAEEPFLEKSNSTRRLYSFVNILSFLSLVSDNV